MGLMEVIDKIREMRESSGQEGPELDDWETRDRGLKSMRRLRRRQLDLVEKEKLKKQINLFERNRTRREVFGIMQNKESSGKLIKPKAKKTGFLGKQKKQKNIFF